MLKEAMADYAAYLDALWLQDQKYDRTKTVGASEIGLCARKVFWTKFEGTKRGVKRDEDYEEQWGARIRGSLMERVFWAPAMVHKFGDNIMFTGRTQVTLASGPISATPDAVIVNQTYDMLKEFGIDDIGGNGCILAESKTIDPRTNLTEAKTENYMQTIVQMGLVRECTDYKPQYDLLCYMDASFWSEVHEFVVPFDQDLYNVAKTRANSILNASNGSELKPEGWIAGGKECSFCPFVKACGVERRAVPQHNVKASAQFEAEILDYARQYLEIEAGVESEKTKLKDLQNTIKVRLQEKGVRRIEGIINWYKVRGRTYYNVNGLRDRLTELGEDADAYASVGEESDRLIIAANLPAEPSRLPLLLLPGQTRTTKPASKAKSKKQKVKAKRKRT
jgi:hypothetical protein